VAGRRWSRSSQRFSDDRAWSAHTSVPPRSSRTDLVAYTALPAETGPTFAPDRLSIWPVEGGRFGIDAHYHGHTGGQRAEVRCVASLAPVCRRASGKTTPERSSASAHSPMQPPGSRSKPSSANRFRSLRQPRPKPAEPNADKERNRR
jgi:hypothetical protein